MEYLKNVQYIEYIVGAIVVILMYIAWHKGKSKEVKLIVTTAIHGLMVQAENFLKSGEGEKKKKEVLEKYKEFIDSLPIISKTLVKLFFGESKVEKLIDDLVPSVEKLLGNFEDNDFNFFKESVLKILSDNIETTMFEKGIDQNKSILTFDEFTEFNKSLIDLKKDDSLLELYGNLKTNFKDETNAEAGVKFIKKF